ncbi:hypothetical protein D3C87_1760890 [compost metagenome]
MRIHKGNNEHDTEQRKGGGGDPNGQSQLAYAAGHRVGLMLKARRTHPGVVHRANGQPHHQGGSHAIDKHAFMSVA